MNWLLLLTVFVVATCGLVYELLCGALASYLLGDSVMQFSTVIGVYLFAMGIGSWLSRYVERRLVFTFAQIEISLGMLGGWSVPLLFSVFEWTRHFQVVLYAVLVLLGTFVGLEIPLMLRLLKERIEFKDLISRVFSLDYVGALFACLLFPLVLMPHLGLMRTGMLFGMFNIGTALLAIHLMGAGQRSMRLLGIEGWLGLASLGFGFAYAEPIQSWVETSNFPDPMVYAQSTPYQRIVLTKSGHDFRLYLNGNLQFSSRDEYRYHEALVHPGLAALPAARKVLVLGGGDGLALREVFKYPQVDSAVLVDLDPGMTALFRTNPRLVEMNDSSLHSPKLRIVNADAFQWLRQSQERFDFIVIDFPDPSNFSLGKLYTTTFYQNLEAHLSPGGLVAIQSTSPFVARKAFWTVVHTVEAVGWVAIPYHVFVPSFGEWGYVLLTKTGWRAPEQFPEGLRFMNASLVRDMLHFPPDMAELPTDTNRLNNQSLVREFEKEWDDYMRGGSDF